MARVFDGIGRAVNGERTSHFKRVSNNDFTSRAENAKVTISSAVMEAGFDRVNIGRREDLVLIIRPFAVL
jgi:hypothetical protein